MSKNGTKGSLKSNQHGQQQRAEPVSWTLLEVTKLQPLTINTQASFTQNKMQKAQYYKGMNSEGLKTEWILGCYADNINRIYHTTVCKHTAWKMHCKILTQDYLQVSYLLKLWGTVGTLRECHYHYTSNVHTKLSGRLSKNLLSGLECRCAVLFPPLTPCLPVVFKHSVTASRCILYSLSAHHLSCNSNTEKGKWQTNLFLKRQKKSLI